MTDLYDLVYYWIRDKWRAHKFSREIESRVPDEPKEPVSRKLKTCVIGAMLGTALTVAPKPLVETPRPVPEKALFWVRHSYEYQKKFKQDWNQAQEDRKARQREHEIDLLAQLLYGEAGVGADGIEVLHTVFNRLASDKFSNDLETVVTEGNQYVGYKRRHPILPQLRRKAELVHQEWVASGKKPVPGCGRYYFLTDVPGVNNKFEVDLENGGTWVAPEDKEFTTHYCPVAYEQNARFWVNENQSNQNPYLADRGR